MSRVRIQKEGTTRRGFVKSAAVGAGSIALALRPGLIASPARESKYQKHILTGSIEQYGELQVFEVKGKDARGYNFALQMSPVGAVPLMTDLPAADADRVKAYIGGDPKNVKDIGTQIEVSIGSEPEVYTISSAAVTYIPKGTPHRQRLLKQPERQSFVLTLSLPPKYVEPTKPEK